MGNGSSPLGIIAGSGAFPKVVIEAAAVQNRPVFIVALTGADPDMVAAHPHMWARMGEAGKIMKRLRQENITDLIMAGGVRRPSLRELKPDRYAARFFLKIGRHALGDDGLLRSVVRTLEEEGFNLIGPAELISDVLAPAGSLSKKQPSNEEQADISRAVEILKTAGVLDIGQALVIQNRIVLGIEAAEGTDRLIERTGPLARVGSKPILVKISKPTQDLRFDMPTIGAETLKNAAKAGLSGVACEARKTILLDAPLLGNLADELGLFLVGIA